MLFIINKEYGGYKEKYLDLKDYPGMISVSSLSEIARDYGIAEEVVIPFSYTEFKEKSEIELRLLLKKYIKKEIGCFYYIYLFNTTKSDLIEYKNDLKVMKNNALWKEEVSFLDIKKREKKQIEKKLNTIIKELELDSICMLVPSYNKEDLVNKTRKRVKYE